jgi:hypothetical protein
MDTSDVQVFDNAAEPGEWAVSGAFAFADRETESLTGKDRQAFANGFLGTGSFGWSTFVAIAEISEAEYDAIVAALSAHFVALYGAPDMGAALPTARAEAEFAAELCEYPVDTLLCVSRDATEGGIRERFRRVEPWRSRLHAPVWTIAEDDG